MPKFKASFTMEEALRAVDAVMKKQREAKARAKKRPPSTAAKSANKSVR